MNITRTALRASTESALQVSNYIIKKLGKVDAKKLQKLLYYCCAFYYTLEGKHFLNESVMFEAWVHGPVNFMTYARFADKSRMLENITYDKDTMPIDKLSEKEMNFLDEVIDLLGKYQGFQLEAMTHSEEPWLEKRRGLGEFEASNSVISYTTIKKYYGDKVSR